MLTAEIKVNGTLIAHLYARNITFDKEWEDAQKLFAGAKVVVPDTKEHKYKYEYYEIGSGKTTSGNVSHIRNDGAAKLISVIMDDMEKNKKEKQKRDKKKATGPAGEIIKVAEGKKNG